VTREATIADIPQLLEWGREFHKMGGLRCAYRPEAVEAMLAGLIEGETGVVLMHDHGMIGGVLVPAYCDPDWWHAVEMFWWSSRDGRTLLRAFEVWAEGVGAQEVRMTSLAELPSADVILKRRGYAPNEISYSKVI
jgi:hypothetical protein